MPSSTHKVPSRWTDPAEGIRYPSLVYKARQAYRQPAHGSPPLNIVSQRYRIDDDGCVGEGGKIEIPVIVPVQFGGQIIGRFPIQELVSI
jgi:hypothetical protein